MKIVTNIQYKQVGGIGRAVSGLATYIKKTNLPITFVGLGVSSAAPHVAEKTFSWEPFTDATFSGWSLKTPNGLWAEKGAGAVTLKELQEGLAPLIAAYITQLRAESPELVLLNGTYYRPWCLLQAARALNLPTVLYYHGSVVQESLGMKTPPNIFSAMEADFYDSVAYIFPSALAKEQARKSFSLDAARAFVVPNSVSELFFNTFGSHTLLHMGIVARWEPIKNTEFILHFAEYNSTTSDPFEIEIISDVSNDHIAQYSRNHFSFTSPMEPVALAAFYAAKGSVICPSHFETFGYVPAEAVAAGTPAFVGPHTGIAEVFRNVGLERLVIAFTNPEQVYKDVLERAPEGIRESERNALRTYIGEGVADAAISDILLSFSK